MSEEKLELEPEVKEKEEMKKQFAPEIKLARIDLGAGSNCKEGFKSVDKFQNAEGTIDFIHDLLVFPWPFPDNSIDEVHCSHFFEHVPGHLRGEFMDELYRVMKPKAQASIIVPYARSMRSIQDYTHQWPPIAEESFLYFNKGWREANKLTHGYYDLKCDFDYGFAHAIDNMWAMRNEEARAFAMRHYWSVAADLNVVLTKRPPEEK